MAWVAPGLDDGRGRVGLAGQAGRDVPAGLADGGHGQGHVLGGVVAELEVERERRVGRAGQGRGRRRQADVAGRLGIDAHAHGQDVGRAAAPAGHPDLGGRRRPRRPGRRRRAGPCRRCRCETATPSTTLPPPRRLAVQPSGHAGQVERDVRVADRGDGQVEARPWSRARRPRPGTGVVISRPSSAATGAAANRLRTTVAAIRADAARARRTALVGKGTTLLVFRGRRRGDCVVGVPRTAGAKSLSNGRNLPHRLAYRQPMDGRGSIQVPSPNV